MKMITPFEAAAGVLPFELRQIAMAMPEHARDDAEELRLRVGGKLSVTMPEGEMVLPGCPCISTGDLHTVLEIATQASAHVALERVKNGFVSLMGGHRMGLCGTAVTKDGEIYNLRELSSINIRIAKQVKDAGNDLLRQLKQEEVFPSVLVLAPPGAGKTTLLRDLIRGISAGVVGRPMRVGVADERGELAATYRGVPQLDIGPFTDVMDGCSKADGLLMLLRGMNPQVLAVDEITAPKDIDALEMAAGCGTTLLATAHGKDVNDLMRRPLYARLLNCKIFKKVILIERQNGGRKYRVEDIPC